MLFKLEERERVFTASGAGLCGVDIAPLLLQVAAPVALVFNVAWSIVDNDDVPGGAGELAADIGVQTDAHELVDGQELLVMASADLPAFFDGWRQFAGYGVDVLDVPAPPTAAEVGDAVAAVDQPAAQRRRFRTQGQERRF